MLPKTQLLSWFHCYMFLYLATLLNPQSSRRKLYQDLTHYFVSVTVTTTTDWVTQTTKIYFPLIQRLEVQDQAVISFISPEVSLFSLQVTIFSHQCPHTSFPLGMHIALDSVCAQIPSSHRIPFRFDQGHPNSLILL